MYKIYCRIFQIVMRFAAHFLPWRMPELIEGQNSLAKLPGLIKSKGINNILIVTDKGITALGLTDGLTEGLKKENIEFTIYDKTVPNPTIDNIEEALAIYKSNKCQGLVAIGGGSSMDCAKGVGARVARPGKTIQDMKGVLKVRRRLPPLFAIPTTAGTGSETTIAAVVTNSLTHEKYPVNDMSLIPHYAILDPMLTVGLPKHITSTTGMDALTHAVEAYIGRSNTRETRDYARKAVKLIFENVYTAYSDGKNIKARENMQKASFYGGIAFTRAYVGYVHALAHTLGGFYGTAHGLANAVILPYVLEYFGKSAHKPLAELADLVGICGANDSVDVKAIKFIDAVRKLNSSMEIPEKIPGIREEDLPLMVDRAFSESNPLYPVPRILMKNDMMTLYKMIRE